MDSPHRDKPALGWREWAALPDLDIPLVKVKVDTGARTSALHATHIQVLDQGGEKYVRFHIHPEHHGKTVVCEALLLERRQVTNSGGAREKRYVIRTRLKLGTRLWWVEVTLTNRLLMGFRMLLGRTAIRKRFVVDPAASFLQGPPAKARKRNRIPEEGAEPLRPLLQDVGE